MFRVDQSQNRLVRIERPSFGDLNLTEVKHLQEWLAAAPDALGEDLLIIQKEFAGFDGTQERLDLLALDKKRRLVVIENKLDDSGRDVVWQAVKYAAYCSTLTHAQVVDSYQQYLNKWHPGQTAEKNLCNFLGTHDLDEQLLNADNEQRLILVSANFRKEVTSTALWLIQHGIDVKCVRVSPYRLDDHLLVDLRQIIPTPETADYVIKIAEKASEKKGVEEVEKRRHAFWSKALEALHARDIARYDNINPTTSSWLASATGMTGCQFWLVFGKRAVRVELRLDRNKSDNKWLFGKLEEQRTRIDRQFGKTLQWDRLDEQISSRIYYSRHFDGYDEKNWPEMIDWLCRHFVKLEKAFAEPLEQLNQELKSS